MHSALAVITETDSFADLNSAMAPYDEEALIDVIDIISKSAVIHEGMLEQKEVLSRLKKMTPEEQEKFLESEFNMEALLAETDSDFIELICGEDQFGDKDEIVKYGNPNGQWDYWEIGGRWSNMLFECGKLEPVDQCFIKNLDVQRMETEGDGFVIASILISCGADSKWIETTKNYHQEVKDILKLYPDGFLSIVDYHF